MNLTPHQNQQQCLNKSSENVLIGNSTKKYE